MDKARESLKAKQLINESRSSDRHTSKQNKKRQRPVQHGRQMPLQDNDQNKIPPVETAKMLLFLSNGEQRLVTFTLPRESCTLQEVLEQINVAFTENTHIQCLQSENSEIDYFVSVGCATRIEDMLENHPLLFGDDVDVTRSNRSSRYQHRRALRPMLPPNRPAQPPQIR